MFSRTDLKAAIIRNPLIVKPKTTVMAAIAQMSSIRAMCDINQNIDKQIEEIHLEARSSCVLVMENDRLVGILTERDIVLLSAQQQNLDNLAIEQVIANSIITLRESAFTDIFFTINLLQQHHIRHLPIVDDEDRLVGLVTHESLRQICRPIDLLRLRQVSEVMTRNVIYATPDSELLAIAQLMAANKISCVIIIESGDSPTTPLKIPVGIITERDIVQFQALGLNLKTCQAQLVMSKPIFTVQPNDNLLVVNQIMQQHCIRRLAVTGQQGEILGIITQTTLLQVLNPLYLYNLTEVLQEKIVNLEAEKITLLENRNTELEKQVQTRTAALKAQAKREKLIAQVATQIRSSLSLQTILDTTVEQIRQVLDCDRVNIWRLEPNLQTVAVAESTAAHIRPSLIGKRIKDAYFQQKCAPIYYQGYVHIVPDIDKIAMSECHRDLLIHLQTRAKILVPIICDDKLWGLLNVIESQHPRDWQPEEVELLQVLSVQLGIAIQQATNHQKLQDELRERKQAEARLRESKQSYASLAAAVPVGIFRTDIAGNYTYVNELWCKIAGLTPETAMGKGWLQALHPEDRDAIDLEWHQSIQENRSFHLEYRFQRPDGSVTYVYGQSVAEYDAEGEVIGYVGTITDISERKQAEQKLQLLNQALESKVKERTQQLLEVNYLQQAILDSADYSIISTNSKGIIQTFNAAAEKMLGYSANEVIGKSTPELIHDYQEMLDRAASLSIQLGQDIPTSFEVFVAKTRQGIVSEEEWTYIRKDGSRCPVLLSVSALKNANQEIIGFLGIAKDITERKLLEQKLVYSENKMRAIFESITDIILTINVEGEELGSIEIPPIHNSLINTRYAEIIDTTITIWEEESLNNGWLQKVIEVVIARQAIQFDYSLQIGTDILWFSAIISPINNTTATWVARDITDRKLAEVEQEKLSNRLALALKSGAIGCWEWDIQDNIILWDERMYQLYGITKESNYSVLYDLWLNSLHPDDRISTETLLRQAVLGETAYDTEFRVLHPDGSIHFIQASGVVVRDVLGNLQSVIGINFDITDRKQAEIEKQHLIQELTAFKLALDQSAIVAITDAKGVISYVNDRFCEISGYSRNELIGQTHRIIKSGYHPPAFFQNLWQTIARGEIWRSEICNRKKDGSLYWVESTIVPFVDTKGRPFQYLGIRFEITARKLAEAAIQQENNFRQQILENMAEGLCVCYEIDSFPFVRFTVWNQQMQVITGYTLEEINCLGWYQSLYPDPEIQTMAIARMQRMRQGENMIAEEWEIQPKYGEKRIIAISTSLVANNDGDKYSLALIQDITTRKQIEEKLAESEAKFRRLVEGANDVIWSCNVDGIVNYLSPQFSTLFGWNENEWIGKKVQEFVHPEDISSLNNNYYNLLASGKKINNYEFRHRHKNGYYIWVRTSATPVKNEQGKIISIQGILSDISDFKQAEIALQASENQFRKVFTSNVVGMMFTNFSGKIMDANDRFLEILGYTRADFNANKINWADITPTEYVVKDQQVMEHLERYRMIEPWEKEYYRKDGSRVPVIIGVALLTEIDSTCVCVVVDISDRKKYENQLQRTNEELARATRLKDEFLANMSHELRTPLNAILGMTEGLQEKAFGDINEKQLKALQTIERSGSHLLELINDILDVAKIESGQIKLECAPVAISRICQSSITFIKQQALKKNIKVEIKIPPDLPDLLLDERRIRQVLINLLNNAVKFTPQGGHITLEVNRKRLAEGLVAPPLEGITKVRVYRSTLEAQEGRQPHEEGLDMRDYLQISITDTGIGIAPENIKKLFQPFIQIDSALNRQYQGTGLGLSLVKRIVELHGGEVGLTSKLGFGSCFSIYLPYSSVESSCEPKPTQQPEPEKNPTTPSIQPTPKSSPVILLAEDNELNIITLSSYLKANGYRIILAKNGQEAVNLAKEHQPDLILMDIQMPVMDGLEAMRLIRLEPNLVNIPIIVLTALAMPGDRERCLQAGANDYLSKPIKLKQLTTCIQQFLIKPQKE